MKEYHAPHIAISVTLSTLLGVASCSQPLTPGDLGSEEQLSTISTSGLHLWLRADMSATRSDGQPVSNGDHVARWLDQSGQGRNAAMATPSRQPSYVANAIHGLPVLRFNGVQSMYLDVVAQPTTFSVFVVGKNSTPTETFSMILGPGGNSANNQLRWENGSNALFVGTGNNMPTITSPIQNTRIYHEMSAIYTGSTMSVYRNGNSISSHSFTTSGPWTLASVGSYYSSYYMTGDLAEVIIYDRALSASERASVDLYLQGKYFSSCGDGACNGNEDNSTCPLDCTICGDGFCGADEDAWGCPSDCSFCGDGTCGSNETSWTCPDDCASCGDGFCSRTEGADSCPSDCGSPGFCGDGLCDSAEDADSCPFDCGGGDGGGGFGCDWLPCT